MARTTFHGQSEQHTGQIEKRIGGTRCPSYSVPYFVWGHHIYIKKRHVIFPG